MYYEATDLLRACHSALDWAERKISGSWVSRAFIHSSWVKWYTPPIVPVRTFEVEEPFRRSRSLLVRVWADRALVLGFWGKTEYDEDTQLLDATLLGRSRTNAERDAWDETVIEVDPRAEGLRGGLRTWGPGLRDRASANAGADVRGHEEVTPENFGKGFNDE